MKNLWKRFLELLSKLLSLKVVAAVAVSYIFLKEDKLGIAGYIIVASFWAFVIGMRYFEKLQGIIKKD